MKKVGYSVYVHKSAINQLLSYLDTQECKVLQKIISYAEQLSLSYCIIKFNKESQTVSLIQCNTWDILQEPVVGDSYCFKEDLSYKLIKGGTKVYHNKWQFVNDDYTGFDVQAAKERTKEWNKIEDIKLYKSKIGNKDFWHQLLQKNGLSI